MAYTVFARKYRPQTFEELVGQEHVARTIGNAISSGRVAHAFLFTGVRGVGKTTTARLLAKSLNCEHGPALTPCNACGPCIDITAGRDVDVQEIDGASNNGVEDVRRLQDTLPFRPSRDRYKIVIVDEVHMLSNAAFNAFLKTLEEPPPHVKFIFATTESHKVPVTIRSRCQRYDFRLIPQAVVAERVRTILSREGIRADDAAVRLVAREAAGSMRDALTLLDQLVAFAGEALEGAEIARQLGVAGREHLQSVLAAVLGGDARAALVGVHALTEQGVDPLHFVRQLVELVRDLAVHRAAGGDAGLVDWVEEDRVFAERLLEGTNEAELARVFSMVARLVDEVARTNAPVTALEMGLLRIASRPALRGIDELLARVSELEVRLRSQGGGGGGGAGSTGGASGARGGSPSRSASTRSAAPEQRGEAPQPSQEENTGRFEGFVPSSERTEAPKPRERSVDPAVARAIAIARGERLPEPPTESPSETPETKPETETTRTEPRKPWETAPKATETQPKTTPSQGLRRSALLEWAPIVKAVASAHPALGSMLEHGVPRVVSKERIILSFQEGAFYGRHVATSEARAIIAEIAAHALGAAPEIEVKFDADSALAAERSIAAVEAQRRGSELESRKKQALEHPAVLDALDVFPDARSHTEVRFHED